ncbi:sodium/proline symporter [Roseiconus lacunae]|uniref:Sodium/proline symporter n=1 Tax=Roseiconus lacunae TaxID=2605694 RepID=A0ABT7PNY8_9BACT|nr:sodium/proline symporter [Roseiconus lacunae]MDM4018197.1 sodium/proline symporter [Roseiconus lacunae]
MEIATISFAFCILGTLAVGLWASRRGKSEAVDYLLSSRDHGAVVTSLSASATDVSGWVLMGLVGMAFSTGLGVLWVIPAGLLGYALNWGLVARRIRERSKADGFVTFPGFLASGYSSKMSAAVRLITSIVILVFLTYYVSGQFNAAGKALRTFFEIPYELGVIVALAISLPYVIVAGMRGTSWSDVVQASLIGIAVIFVPIAALSHVGGLGSVVEGLRNIDPAMVSLTSGKSGSDAILHIVFWLSIGLAYPGQPQILTRFMAAKDDHAVTRGRWIAVGWFLLVSTMAVLAGLTARVGFADNAAIVQDSEQIIPALAALFLPAVLVGVVLAAVTAAIMSTADSMVLVLLTTLLADIRNVDSAKTKSFSIATRIGVGTIVAGTAAAIAFLSERKVFTVVLEAWAILGGAFVAVVFYRLWWDRTSPVATLAGIIAGLVAALFLNGDNYQIQIAASIIASAVAVAIAHVATAKATPLPQIADTPNSSEGVS